MPEDVPQCIARVSEPPWYIRWHQCEHKGKHTIGKGHRVCGTHLKVAKRWQGEGRLEAMIKAAWLRRA